jgi:hypothetical protein
MSEKVGKIGFYPMTAVRLEFTRSPPLARILPRFFQDRQKARETPCARREPYRGTPRTMHFKIRPDGTDCPCNAN